MSPDELSNRIEVKALIDAYAYCADHKKPVEYAALYAEDAIIEIFQGNPEGAQPIAVLNGREEIVKGFHDHLMPYELTQHFICQSILRLGEDDGTGETYTLAHNISMANGQRTMTVIGVRYEDVFTRRTGQWLFLKRRLILLWSETRPI